MFRLLRPLSGKRHLSLERQLRSHGYDSLLCCTGTSLENKRTYFELLLSKRVDAVILAGSKFVELIDKNNDYLIEAAKRDPRHAGQRLSGFPRHLQHRVQ